MVNGKGHSSEERLTDRFSVDMLMLCNLGGTKEVQLSRLIMIMTSDGSSICCLVHENSFL